MEAFLVVFLLAFLVVVAAVARYVDASRKSRAREHAMAPTVRTKTASPSRVMRHDVGRLGEHRPQS
jgi:hypothetical protein